MGCKALPCPSPVLHWVQTGLASVRLTCKDGIALRFFTFPPVREFTVEH